MKKLILVGVLAVAFVASGYVRDIKDMEAPVATAHCVDGDSCQYAANDVQGSETVQDDRGNNSTERYAAKGEVQGSETFASRGNVDSSDPRVAANDTDFDAGIIVVPTVAANDNGDVEHGVKESNSPAYAAADDADTSNVVVSNGSQHFA